MSETDTNGYTILELRAMDREEARQTLPVAEFERWEQLTELEEGAEQTREQWADEAETVVDVAVHADAEALGTELDLYGNDVLVHVDSEDTAFKRAAEAMDSALPDDGVEDSELTDARAERLTARTVDVLDAMLLRWNGTEWDTLSPDQRQRILQRARDKWGLEATVMAVIEAVKAIQTDREQTKAAVEAFLGETGGGDN